MTSHRDCDHPKTKTARAKCRRASKLEQSSTRMVEVAYGTFEVRKANVSEITDKDHIYFESEKTGNWFTPVSTGAFQVERVDREGRTVKSDTYTISIGATRHYVSADTEYLIAVDREAVRSAAWKYTRSLTQNLTRGL